MHGEGLYNHKIILVDAVPYRDVLRLMQAMDVGLSLRRSAQRDSSEWKVWQYLTSGLCVIGTAGSNNFLQNSPFAKVIDSISPEAVVAAAAKLVEHGADGIRALGHRAKAPALSNLSAEAKHEKRIAFWEHSLRTAGALT